MLALSVLDVHSVWAWIMIITNAAAGVWCLGAHWLAPLRQRSLWWVVIAAQVAVFIQIVMGIIMVADGRQHTDGFHILYGASAIVSVGILYGYRNTLRAKAYLLYGVGCLWIMGLGLRALQFS